jgi:hypothetical protein
MRRREFITLLGGAAATWPLAARAQQGQRVRRVGVLIVAYTQTDPEAHARVAAFLDTFQKLGWADGRNVRIEYRCGADRPRDRDVLLFCAMGSAFLGGQWAQWALFIAASDAAAVNPLARIVSAVTPAFHEAGLTSRLQVSASF